MLSRDRPIVGEDGGPGTLQDGPRPGERAPDATGLRPDSMAFPIRLHELLRHPGHPLVLFPRDETGWAAARVMAAAVAQRTGDRVRSHILVAPGVTIPDVSGLTLGHARGGHLPGRHPLEHPAAARSWLAGRRDDARPAELDGTRPRHPRPRRRRVHRRPTAPHDRPELRLELLAERAADPAVTVLLLDVVLGHGADPDPAGTLGRVIRSANRTRRDGGSRTDRRGVVVWHGDRSAGARGAGHGPGRCRGAGARVQRAGPSGGNVRRRRISESRAGGIIRGVSGSSAGNIEDL